MEWGIYYIWSNIIWSGVYIISGVILYGVGYILYLE